MKFLLVALLATVVCSASADLSDFLGHVKELKEMKGDMGKAVIEKIKCHVDAITEAVKGTDLEHKWKVVLDEIVEVNKKIIQCVKDNKSPLDAAKCVATEALKVRSIVKEFLESMKSDYTDIYHKIKEATKKC